MNCIYIDESGSMTCKFHETHPYFVISIVFVKDLNLFKRSYKYFIRKYYKDLKDTDSGKMFKENKFLELKGSEFSSDLKKKFVDFFSRSNAFDIFFIVLDNKNIEDKYYKNNARAFNYILTKAFKYFINQKYLPRNEEFLLHIDERNERPDAKKTLEDYMCTTLILDQELVKDIKVKYFDSSNIKGVQIADVFANIIYSNLMTGNYKQEISLLKNKGILKCIFKFPKFSSDKR